MLKESIHKSVYLWIPWCLLSSVKGLDGARAHTHFKSMVVFTGQNLSYSTFSRGILNGS